MPKIKYEGFSSYPGIVEGQVPSDLILDPIQYVPYRQTYLRVADFLTIGAVVPEDMDVSVVGNNTLLESSFRLRELDKQPIETVGVLGKSAHVAHTEDVAIACLTMLSRKGKREDNLYTVQAGQLGEIGFSALYAPTGKKLLHLRLVPASYDEYGDIPIEDRINLVELLQRHKIHQLA